MSFFSRLGNAFKSSALAPLSAGKRLTRASLSLAKHAALDPALATARFARHPTGRGFLSILTSPALSTGRAAAGVARASVALPTSPSTAFARALAGKKQRVGRRPTPGRLTRAQFTELVSRRQKKPGFLDFLTKPTMTTGTSAAPSTSGAGTAPPPTAQASYAASANADEDTGLGPGGEEGDDTSDQTDLETALARETGTMMSTASSPPDRDTQLGPDNAGDEMPFDYGGSSSSDDDSGASADDAYDFERRVPTVDKGDGVEIPIHMYETRASEEGDDDSDATMYAESLGLGDFKSDLESGLKKFGEDAAKEGASRLLKGAAKEVEDKSKGRPKKEYEIEEKPMSTGKKLVIGAAVAVPLVILASRFLRPKKAATNPRRRRSHRRR